MFQYFIRRVLVMIPTLLVISALVFIIIQLPEGDYLTSHIAELEAQGEKLSQDKIDFLRQQYGLDNVGQIPPAGLFDADIDAPEAWDLYTGSSNVVIAGNLLGLTADGLTDLDGGRSGNVAITLRVMRHRGSKVRSPFIVAVSFVTCREPVSLIEYWVAGVDRREPPV